MPEPVPHEPEPGPDEPQQPDEAEEPPEVLALAGVRGGRQQQHMRHGLREAAGQPVPVADVAASFQEAVVDVLTRKAVAACREHGVDHLLIGGGVAANSRLRALAEERCADAGVVLRVPRPALCTDNGAMVAALGARLVSAGRVPSMLDLPASSSMQVTLVQA